jgi:hypothetical protein
MGRFEGPIVMITAVILEETMTVGPVELLKLQSRKYRKVMTRPFAMANSGLIGGALDH